LGSRPTAAEVQATVPVEGAAGRRGVILRVLEKGGMQRNPLQTDYWDRVAPEKRFSHPLRLEWLLQNLRPPARILDHGCGYGRVLDQLVGGGYGNAVGMDFSEKMLTQCRSKFPHLTLVRNDGRTLPFRDRSFDAVLLFTVLTCIPSDDDQRALLGEVRRVLRPGGILYISDLLINTDLRNLERYERHANEFGVYGVFALPEGVIVRHHREEWIEQLTGAFARLAFEHFTVTTMNGNPSAAFQYLGRVSTR
jgi:ubiquinone/menaquinone biosynthesis C-methylase UbiE